MRFAFRLPPVMKLLLLPFAATRESSYAELGDDALRVRFGALFRHDFSYASVQEVSRGRWPLYYGLGLRLALGKRLGVIASTANVVRVHFREPQGVPLFLGLPWPTSELFLSLEDPDGFVAASQARLHAA